MRAAQERADRAELFGHSKTLGCLCAADHLTPLFAALLSAAFLGELPHLYHALAFVLIVGGIVVPARR